MNHPAPYLAIIILFLSTCIRASADDDAVKISHLQLSLPAGYRHEPLRGADSQIGVIHVAEKKFDIEYQAGPGTGTARQLETMTPADLVDVIYYERTEFGGMSAYFVGIRGEGRDTGGVLWLCFPEASTGFFIRIAKPSTIQDARAAFLRIKFTSTLGR